MAIPFLLKDQPNSMQIIAIFNKQFFEINVKLGLLLLKSARWCKLSACQKNML